MTSEPLYGKHLAQSHFGVIFGVSILNNSHNRLKYVFEQIIFIAAIEKIFCNKNKYKRLKFYFIW